MMGWWQQDVLTVKATARKPYRARDGEDVHNMIEGDRARSEPPPAPTTAPPVMADWL